MPTDRSTGQSTHRANDFATKGDVATAMANFHVKTVCPTLEALALEILETRALVAELTKQLASRAA